MKTLSETKTDIVMSGSLIIFLFLARPLKMRVKGGGVA